MTGVLGLPLQRAMEILAREGVTVTEQEARSRKGVNDGSDARVIRQDIWDETHVTLIYAVFRTEPNEANA